MAPAARDKPDAAGYSGRREAVIEEVEERDHAVVAASSL